MLRILTNAMPAISPMAGQTHDDTSHMMDHSGMDHSGMDHSGMDHSGMDHSGMDHSGMDHSGHSGMGHDHSGMRTPCKMNMIWNYDTDGLCLVFPSWQITSTTSLYGSLLAIVLLGVGYEWLRLALRRLDSKLNSNRKRRPSKSKRSGNRIRSALPVDGQGSRSTDSGGSILDDDSPYTKSQASLANAGISFQSLFALPPLTLPVSSQLLRSSGYTLSVGLSFFIMLLFMTYNAYVIAAVLVGAGAGHYLFSRADGDGEDDEAEEDRGMSCH